LQVAEYELAAGALGSFGLLGVAGIGDGGKVATSIDPHPAAASPAVAPGQHLGVLEPVVRGICGTLVELVAIGGDDQRVLVIDLVGKQYQAHCGLYYSSGYRETIVKPQHVHNNTFLSRWSAHAALS
jgi:hypothetical protein